MKVQLLGHFTLNDVMEHNAGLPHAHLLCMLCEVKHAPPKPVPPDWVPVPEPPGLDDYYNWTVEDSMLGPLMWAFGHLKKFHPEVLTDEEVKGGEQAKG